MSALQDLGVTVIAASTDPEDKAAESAADLSYPVAHGVTKEQAETLGAYWEPNRPIIQPTEFLLDADHKIITATYSAGPIGRMNASDLVKVVQFNEKKRLGS